MMVRVRALFLYGTLGIGGLVSGSAMAETATPVSPPPTSLQPPRTEGAPAPAPAAAPVAAPAAAPAPAPSPAPIAARPAPVRAPAVVPAAPAKPPVPSKVALAAGAKPAVAPQATAVASPQDAAPQREAKPAPAGERDPWARPHFVKGDLSNFVIRPMTRKNFIGVGAGISAIPNDVGTLLNAFYFTVEPQVDIVNTTYNWRLGLGAPLQFELVDTRSAFETCIGKGREARTAGGNQDAVSVATAGCISTQKDHLTDHIGRLRRADWDSASDFAKVIRYMVIGGQEQPFYLNISRLYDQSFGHGTVVRDYNANLDYNTARLGATLDFNKSAIGVQAMANDLVNPDVVGLMTFVRPMRPYSDSVFWRSLSIGGSFVHGVNLPHVLHYEKGLFTPSFDQPIPQVDSNLKPVGGRYAQVNIFGGDVEAKVLRTSSVDLKLYLDFQKMSGYGSGTTAGALWRSSAGEPAWQALRARAELNYFSADFLPSFFDTYHDIFSYQYLPMGYKGTNGLTYHPTKLQYLDSQKGGRKRLGAYFELSHAFLNYLTLGATARIWRPVGSPGNAGYQGPSFPDYAQDCADKDGELTCGKSVGVGGEPGFTSLRFSAEVPFRNYLQAFASYEVFSTTTEKGLGAFRFDGDNEIFFSGVRLKLLPILFIQAESRRYFFMQRIHSVNLDNLTVQQDQNYHADWTFAVNAFVGYEF
jgi:hypothetical protein